MAHIRERGNILVFVLVGALLFSLLAGGIYLVKHRSTGSTVGVGLTDNVDKTNNSTNHNKDNTNSNDSPQDDQNKKDLQDILQEQANKKQDTKTQDTLDAESSKTQSDKSESANTDSLPTTGPSQSVLAGLGLATITATTMAFWRSKRAV